MPSGPGASAARCFRAIQASAPSGAHPGPLRRPLGRPATGPEDCGLRRRENEQSGSRRRLHTTLPPGPDEPMRVEHEYERKGAWAYLAAWDVRRAKIHGRCERTTGIAPFRRVVRQVMSQEPYRSAPRVFWIVDNGSSHRGQACFDRFTKVWPNIVVVHLHPCELAQPSRELLLDRAAQGAHAQRLPFAVAGPRAPALVSGTKRWHGLSSGSRETTSTASWQDCPPRRRLASPLEGLKNTSPNFWREPLSSIFAITCDANLGPVWWPLAGPGAGRRAGPRRASRNPIPTRSLL